MDSHYDDTRDSRTGLEVAVIGMAGRFPGAGNIDEFWENLKNGVESVSFLTDKELQERKINPQWLNNPAYVRSKGGTLKGKEYFASSFFDYTPLEAALMDPQFRVLHECVWHALENAGYDPYRYEGLIGLYAGSSSNVYWQVLAMLSGKMAQLGEYAAGQLTDKDYLCMRIAYKLNLKGPALVMQSACSTSLAAIHTACQALLNGECHMALAGGVSVSSEQHKGYFYQEGMILSPDGHCRAFDARAKGTIFGNGSAVVVLKLLEEAIKDGDYIHAVVLGSAINNDGNRKSGFTAPARQGQTEVIRTAQMVAEVDTESITYIETHGTGTTLGDPIEMEALTRAFNTDNRGYCAIGSVKTNVGHLDAAAGVTGFIKTVLALEHKQIPPSLNYTRPNPMIDFENSPFYVNTKLTRWKRNSGPLRAAVSSFGIGGTNAHVILEEGPSISQLTGDDGQELSSAGEIRKYKLLLLSARTTTDLEHMTQRLGEFLEKNPGVNLADVAYTLQVGRAAFEHRKMLVCQDAGEAAENLGSPEAGKDNVKTFTVKPGKRSVVFMFSGQGSQYVNMGKGLYEKEPLFREEMDRFFDFLNPLMGIDIKAILYPGHTSPGHGGASGYDTATSPGINRTALAQPLLFAIEYSLAKLLMAWGIRPYAMMGHSIGEYVAACLAGVFSLEYALELVFMRGILMQKQPAGTMLSIPLPEEEIKALLPADMALAAVNGPRSCVASGPLQAAAELEKQLQEKGHDVKRLHTSHAFHSPMMDPVVAEFEKKIKASSFSLQKPEIPYISNVTGQWITSKDAADPAYWARHIRQTVRFSEGIRQCLEEENVIFLEVGPGNALCHFVRQHKRKKQVPLVLNLIRHPRETDPDDYYLLNKLGMMWLYGKSPDWSKFYAGEKRSRMPMPTYPFAGKRFWFDLDPLEILTRMQADKQLMRKPGLEDWFYIPSWERSLLFAPAVDKVDTSASTGSSPSPWLIFSDECGVGDGLKKRLQKEGREVITVKRGISFSRGENGEYIVNTKDSSDYHTLCRQLAEAGKIPGKIIHLWGVTGVTGKVQKKEAKQEPVAGSVSIEDALESGFYSLLYLVQALEAQNVRQDIQIEVVTDHIYEVTGQEVLCPEKATVLGAIKVIPQEYPHIKTCHIDIDSNIRTSEPGYPRQEQVIDRLLKEFTAEFSGPVIAYRGQQRLKQTFVPVKLAEHLESGSKLRQEGVYLITGGLGGVGLVMARFLAQQVNARVILTGRSAFPAREDWSQWLDDYGENDLCSIKIRHLQKIEESGRALVFQADVADPQQMQAVVEKAEKQLGPINGVIHAAGLVGEQSLTGIAYATAADCNRHFTAKVHGLLTLAEIFGSRPLDFCMLTSSLASILGGLGFLAYAAANSFMDAFVQLCNRGNPVPWISVNWDGWQFQEEQADPFSLAVTPREGATAFHRILSCDGILQVAVSTGSLSARIDRWIKLEFLKENKEAEAEQSQESSHPRPDLTTPYAAPETEMEQTMAAIWQQMFDIDQVGIHDDFFELGGDSLQAIQLVRKLNAAHINISVDKIFLYPTINKIYRDIMEKQEPHSITPDGETREKEKKEEPAKPGVTPSATIPGAIEHIIEDEKQKILQELQKNDHLDNLLQNSKCVRKYEVSPIQRSFLAGGETAERNILEFSYDFTYTIGISTIKKQVLKIINEHALFRSVIKQENDLYMINEFEHLPEIHLPFIDISRYSSQSREEIQLLVEQHLKQPFRLTGSLLYRIIVVKTDNINYKIFLAINHIIFDGESLLILDREIDNMNKNKGIRIDGAKEKKLEGKDYHTYVSFLKTRDYENLDLDVNLETYLDIPAYLEHLDKIPGTDNDTGIKKNVEADVFKVDISKLKPHCKDFYHEILFLSYAKLLHGQYKIDRVPLAFYTNGRQYKDASFRNMVGVFFDIIPVLFSFHGDTDYMSMLENFLAYRRYVREANLNFANFILKQHDKGIDYVKLFFSPFIFNPQIGLYDRYEILYREKSYKLPEEGLEFKRLKLNMAMSKDLGSDNLLVRILHNSPFKLEELKEKFMEHYAEMVHYFNDQRTITI